MIMTSCRWRRWWRRSWRWSWQWWWNSQGAELKPEIADKAAQTNLPTQQNVFRLWFACFPIDGAGYSDLQTASIAQWLSPSWENYSIFAGFACFYNGNYGGITLSFGKIYWITQELLSGSARLPGVSNPAIPCHLSKKTHEYFDARTCSCLVVTSTTDEACSHFYMALNGNLGKYIAH